MPADTVDFLWSHLLQFIKSWNFLVSFRKYPISKCKLAFGLDTINRRFQFNPSWFNSSGEESFPYEGILAIGLHRYAHGMFLSKKHLSLFLDCLLVGVVNSPTLAHIIFSFLTSILDLILVIGNNLVTPRLFGLPFHICRDFYQIQLEYSFYYFWTRITYENEQKVKKRKFKARVTITGLTYIPTTCYLWQFNKKN